MPVASPGTLLPKIMIHVTETRTKEKDTNLTTLEARRKSENITKRHQATVNKSAMCQSERVNDVGGCPLGITSLYHDVTDLGKFLHAVETL